ncbi:MAG: phosphoglycolate phosphatase [Hydrogenophaga sp.]|jgi:phosphoglycolate phosphatase|uniref:phosphoglycolate phosphatase n=1 Tax=Hydrogenophaga sp. TaxID=1904254 RepID=UPI0027253BF8|nr:phosphoglycolate phosphatase [Hydrogenophaga sp.]MDO9252699.1 phosphoglycolate phosphatase [Hydrogenophaga sp.]MDP2407043.1 phosphoglycolate phosphatase [Hydrogenophaga sp.]MDP3325034.1 phosphoglycolate phosphatase [Hydrogenophaga sp.]MDZ4177377.1 phosphoglycolate phosphatase [Hydrogenophaga sp.]
MATSYPYDLILFDLDGTLIETAPEIADAVNDTLTGLGHPTVSQQAVNDWIGHGTRELLIQALAQVLKTSTQQVREAEAFPAIEAEFGQHYQRRCGTRSHLYPHVRETLQALRTAGVKLVVMTNKEGRYTQTVLDAHDLAPMFDRVISGDTLPVKKPNPAGITDCLKQFGLSSDRALFVGDSSIDVATARNAGIAVWALPYGYNMGEPIEACNPDRVIPDFSALTTSLPARDTAASA